MFAPFFRLAAQSPSRQRSFRNVVAAHVILLAGVILILSLQGRRAPVAIVGHVLLIAGIVEGAILLGWRLTQLPKSQALEFLLVSPLRPGPLFLAEAAVGFTLLTLVTLSGLPLLVILAAVGYLSLIDLLPLLVAPLTLGTLTGMGLVWWAYEPKSMRRIGEIIAGLGILVYLVVGVMAGEKLGDWLQIVLPEEPRIVLLRALRLGHDHTPFAVIQTWFTQPSQVVFERLIWVQAGTILIVALLSWRASARLEGHFHERHYEPVRDVTHEIRPPVGNRPLSWWAVKRVMEYSGRMNLWLAGGFCLLYAAYIIGASHWPAWMGRQIFMLCDEGGGVATMTVILVVLAAVPASFQYGLWDSSTHERCRRLELLLLTDLQPGDYWHAAAAAAWRRGRGYFFVALGLLLAAWIGGRIDFGAVLAAIAASVLLWALYFALGFRAFARGDQANGMGVLLTLGIPVLAIALGRYGTWLPPGMVYAAGAGQNALWGALLAAGLTLVMARRSLGRCDAQLRAWYDRHHGSKVMN